MKTMGMGFVQGDLVEYTAMMSAGISNPMDIIAAKALTNVPPRGVQQVNAALQARLLVMTSALIRIGIYITAVGVGKRARIRIIGVMKASARRVTKKLGMVFVLLMRAMANSAQTITRITRIAAIAGFNAF